MPPTYPFPCKPLEDTPINANSLVPAPCSSPKKQVPIHGINGTIDPQSLIASASPLPLFISSSSSSSAVFSESSPKLRVGGISLRASLAFCSDHARSRTSCLIRASRLAPWLAKIASFTLVATVCRSEGSSSCASGGARFSGGKIRSAIVRSRSSRNSWFVGARGANSDVANVSAGVMSAFGLDIHFRISSISCRRSNAKCNAGS